jgi:hypothetical protein
LALKIHDRWITNTLFLKINIPKKTPRVSLNLILNANPIIVISKPLTQPTRPVNLRDDGVDIDLPSREEIEGALKYLKNNKAAGADSIAVELLKNGGPNLVDALHAEHF